MTFVTCVPDPVTQLPPSLAPSAADLISVCITEGPESSLLSAQSLHTRILILGP